MTTTPQSTVLPARRTADSGISSYLEQVTAADDFRKAAKTAQTKIARARRTEQEGKDEFAAAVTGMNEAGVTVAQICRDTGVSETHLRTIIKIWTLEHRGNVRDDEQAG